MASASRHVIYDVMNIKPLFFVFRQALLKRRFVSMIPQNAELIVLNFHGCDPYHIGATKGKLMNERISRELVSSDVKF